MNLAAGVLSAQALELRLFNAATQEPLPQATVEWRAGDNPAVTNVSGASGRVAISLPQTGSGETRIVVRKPGFAPLSMHWSGGEVPEHFEFRLPPSQTVGGRIVDASGQPVAGALVRLILPQRLAGPRIAVNDPPARSDAGGRWQCEGVPKDAAYVYAEVSHPDYEFPPQEATLAALQALQAEYKLIPVAAVRGRVLDPAGQPVAGAQVVLGAQQGIWPGSSTPETTTDERGYFEFKRVQLEKRLLGVKAEKAAPALQRIDVKRGLAPVEIRLTAGTPLRVRVLDEMGKPISGAQAHVDEWPTGLPGAPSGLSRGWSFPGWEWETDTEGRFVWNHAPAERALWTFSKGDYMSRGRQGLQTGPEEQTVTLDPAFRVHGKVTDAKTGQAIPEFVLTARFVQINVFSGTTRTNFGEWSEYNRKAFSGGQYGLLFTYPLLSGSRKMHEWQFRAEALGYAPAVSRVVLDRERGLELDFELEPVPPPEIALAAPAGKTRVTAGAALQPGQARPGESVTLFVKARVAPGHHIYALDDSGCGNLPTAIKASWPRLLQPDGPWRGPEPKVARDGSRTLEGELLFQRRFLVERGAAARVHTLPIRLEFQVCNEALCWPAEKIDLETKLEVLPSRR
jgi:Carboxypeptidase regulatory-like domain